jgi:hypothetical protein
MHIPPSVYAVSVTSKVSILGAFWNNVKVTGWRTENLTPQLIILAKLTVVRCSMIVYKKVRRSQWPRGLRRGSATVRLLWSWVRIPPRAWMSVLWVLCVIRYSSLRRADHSSRGVLPSAVCLTVIVRPRQRAGPAPLRTVVPWKTKQNLCQIQNTTLLKILYVEKGEVVPVQAMKAYRGSRGIAPLVFNIGTVWRWVATFTPRPQSRYGRFGEEKNFLCLPGFEPRFFQPVAKSQYQLRYSVYQYLGTRALDPWGWDRYVVPKRR